MYRGQNHNRYGRVHRYLPFFYPSRRNGELWKWRLVSLSLLPLSFYHTWVDTTDKCLFFFFLWIRFVWGSHWFCGWIFLFGNKRKDKYAKLSHPAILVRIWFFFSKPPYTGTYTKRPWRGKIVVGGKNLSRPRRACCFVCRFLFVLFVFCFSDHEGIPRWICFLFTRILFRKSNLYDRIISIFFRVSFASRRVAVGARGKPILLLLLMLILQCCCCWAWPGPTTSFASLAQFPKAFLWCSSLSFCAEGVIILALKARPKLHPRAFSRLLASASTCIERVRFSVVILFKIIIENEDLEKKKERGWLK